MKDLLYATLKAIGIVFVFFLLFGGWVTWHMSKEGFSFPGPGHQDYSAYLAGDYSVYRTSPFAIIIASGSPSTSGLELRFDGDSYAAFR